MNPLLSTHVAGMEPLLSDADCCKYLLQGLSKEEGLASLPTCKSMARAMEPFFGGLAFASTRPKTRTNGPPLSLQEWVRLWQACAASVSADGVDPGLLAHSETVIKTGDPKSEIWACEYEETSGFFCNFIEMSKLPDTICIDIEPESQADEYRNSDARISTIISITCAARGTSIDELSLNAFVLLSSGLFAFVALNEGSDSWGEGTLYLGKDPCDVMRSAKKTWNSTQGVLGEVLFHLPTGDTPSQFRPADVDNFPDSSFPGIKQKPQGTMVAVLRDSWAQLKARR